MPARYPVKESSCSHPRNRRTGPVFNGYGRKRTKVTICQDCGSKFEEPAPQ